jgi:coenzyme F420-0:L-glutamate ligase/coenzyme F420-1:gamma-L-glutamate ligase
VSHLELWALATPHRFVEGDDLVEHLLAALSAHDQALLDGDVVVVTSKVVSKVEGRVVPVGPDVSDKVALVESEATRILRRRGPLRLTETTHGFVNANAGVDLSNTESGTAVLLPRDPDKSARALRATLEHRLKIRLAVIVTDTFGRAWRNGVTDVAIGSAGITPILDLRGTTDDTGRVLEATEVAVVDEIAGAANLVLAKNAGAPFCIVRGITPTWLGTGSVVEHIVRAPAGDLFR